jgi:hypothetical protein
MNVDALLKKNELLKKALLLVKPVAESNPLGDTSSLTYRIVRNVLRKNVLRVQAIITLNTLEDMNDSVLEIARNTIEDSISVSYILSNDLSSPEKLAYEFFEYRWVQAKQDLDYYSKIPDYIGNDLDKDRALINKEFKRVISEYPEFVDKEGNARHSWTKQGVHGMAKQIVKRKLYNNQEKRNLLRVYDVGSRKTHFNPLDILGFNGQKTWSKPSSHDLDITIKVLSATLTSLVIRYFDIARYYDNSVDGSKIILKLYDIQKQIHELD